LSTIAVIGAGPAGLMAADVLANAGHAVSLYDRMPSAGRKFLMAGRGGLNLTHSEHFDRLLERYGPARVWLEPKIRTFPPDTLRAFADALGQETFIGTSGRIFPTAMKASPLLRAWLIRLREKGVVLHLRHRWVGGGPSHLTFAVEGTAGESAAPHTPQTLTVAADAAVLALGGGSWPRLGSDGGWVPVLEGFGVRVEPLAPANCGLTIAWSDHLLARFEGTPLKAVRLSAGGASVLGEAVVTKAGLEGGAVYAISGDVRRAHTQSETAALTIDLKPDLTRELLAARLERPRGKQSMATWLRKSAALSPVAIGLLHEATARKLPAAPGELATLIKAVPFPVTGLAAMDRAISTAGGIVAEEIDAHMMLTKVPGLFVAGEMLDWDAPTGGYLLQASLATGFAAGNGARAWLERAADAA
jgi:uncharacterized flavoprotein (TIGR03862 family)